MSESLALTPQGTLYALHGEWDTHGKSLLALGFSGQSGYWPDLCRLFLSRVCSGQALPIELTQIELTEWFLAVPPMLGAEYLNPDILQNIFRELSQALALELETFEGDLRAFLEAKKSPFSLVGRVCFHLAEKKNDEQCPFAFLATYSHKLSTQGKVQHLPLKRALLEYAGKSNRNQLIQLLKPIQQAVEQSVFLKDLRDSSALYDPQLWTPGQAYLFLKDISIFEAAGIVVRVPQGWQSKNLPRPRVQVQIGDKRSLTLGASTLLDFSVNLSLEGETLTPAEIKQILGAHEGLALIRGKWVQIDPQKLSQVLSNWENQGELSFAKSMRLLAGAEVEQQTNSDWVSVVAGKNLAGQLQDLADPEQIVLETNPKPELQANLRPYQVAGVKWLWMLNKLSLGGCLADDMGLGKSIQIIALLILLKRQEAKPALLILPASLIGNWKNELMKFAPDLKFWVAHPSGSLEEPAQDVNLVISTYGYLPRLPWVLQRQWSLVVLDEAQAIKNPMAKQTQTVKQLKSSHRLALTGTPIENRLGDLWSLYDFLCPGLLGTVSEFKKFILSQHANKALKRLIKPYLLRRLKSDKRVIADLPDKTELMAYCSLSKSQAVLYEQSVLELKHILETVDGIKRRGVILSFLMRFKQICNHPSQWLSDSVYHPQDSGKFARLLELCEEIASRQEKVLIFTQFKEIIEPLRGFLETIFGSPGLILHGETPVKNRPELVAQFQQDLGPPFFILSIKAGGVGLNLTAASHVIHFDRWWNPAVENQATDRAYRIGQKKNVLVHKFVCRGTLEEKIDLLINDKKALSEEILSEFGESKVTELSNEELLQLISLDLKDVEYV